MAELKSIEEATVDMTNIVDIIDDDVLIKLGTLVFDDYERDDASRTNWSETRAKWLKLFMQHTEEKTFPWRGASNVPLPVLTTAIIQFQSRAYEALMPPKDKVKVVHTGYEDRLRSERVAKHMNYQIDYQMPNFEESWDISLTQLPINGSIFRKTFYDPILEVPVSKYCSADEVVVNYMTSPTDTPKRITHVIPLSKDDVKRREVMGAFTNLEEILNEDGSVKPGSQADKSATETDIKRKNDLIEGIVEPTNEDDEGRVFLEQQRWYDLDGDGLEEPYVVTIDFDTKSVVRITKRRTEEDDIIDYWTHYYFFPNPEGYYGLGFGHILMGINEAASSLINQIIDAGTMANMSGKTGFINGRSGIKKGDFQLSLGDYKRVDVQSDDIRKAIYSFDFPGPSNVLFQVLGLLQDYTDRVTTVSETLTGEMPKSDTPATATINAIEQGLKVFSVIHKRIHRVFKKELKKIYVLNAIYPNNEQYLKVLGDDMVKEYNDQDIAINMAEDYAGSFDIRPVSDPNIASKSERVAIAEQVYNITLQSPVTSGSITAITEAQKRLYEAMDVPDIAMLLPPPQTPPDLPQIEENAMMLREEEIHALQPQLHLQHLEVMQDFEVGTYMEDLTPRGKRLFEQHKQEHISMQYMVENQPAQPPGTPGAI